MSSSMVRANGILADTGNYALEMTLDAVYQGILAERHAPTPAEAAVAKAGDKLGLPYEYDPKNLLACRWGLIVPDPVPPKVQQHLDHLAPLIALRKTQMQDEPPVFKCPPSLSFDTFVEAAAQMQFGEVDPPKFPYYLCIVAPPDDPALNWEFQCNLDLQYSVGRIWFDDPDDCKAYVDKLVAREKAQAKSNRATLFVSPVFPNDKATVNSHEHFIVALRDWAAGQTKLQGAPLDLMDPEAPNAPAKRKNLTERLGANRPALLFTATHGVVREPMDPVDQGALLLQDWPGPENPVLPGHFLTEADLPADLDGMLAFSFACYSAGAPRFPDWIHPTEDANPLPISDRAFVSRLAQKMLALGAPAFIGHVSKAWDYSFLSINLIQGAYGQTLTAFQSALKLLLNGYPAAFAMEAMNNRCLLLNMMLDNAIGNRRPHENVVSCWVARNDCRGYVVLGDPFAHLIV